MGYLHQRGAVRDAIARQKLLTHVERTYGMLNILRGR